MNIGVVVFLIFLVLKLAGIGVVATWSWWLITLPLWIGFAIAAVRVFLTGVAQAVTPTRKPFKRW